MPRLDRCRERRRGRVVGVEATLWSETLVTMHDVEYMAFPRLLALAEVASTRLTERRWEDFEARLPALERRLDELGVAYFPTAR